MYRNSHMPCCSSKKLISTSALGISELFCLVRANGCVGTVPTAQAIFGEQNWSILLVIFLQIVVKIELV